MKNKNETSTGEGFRSPLRAAPGPLRDFIQSLRDLKEAAGNPSINQIKKALVYDSRAAIAALFNGPSLGPRDLTLRVVEHLGGDKGRFAEGWGQARDWIERQRRWAAENPLIETWPTDEDALPRPLEVRAIFRGLGADPKTTRATAHPVRERIFEFQAQFDQYLRSVLKVFGVEPGTDPRDAFKRMSSECSMSIDRYRFLRLASLVENIEELTASVLHDYDLNPMILVATFASYVTTVEMAVEVVDQNMRDLVIAQGDRFKNVRAFTGSGSEDGVLAEEDDLWLSLLFDRHPSLSPLADPRMAEARKAAFDRMIANYDNAIEAFSEYRNRMNHIVVSVMEAKAMDRDSAEELVVEQCRNDPRFLSSARYDVLTALGHPVTRTLWIDLTYSQEGKKWTAAIPAPDHEDMPDREDMSIEHESAAALILAAATILEVLWDGHDVEVRFSWDGQPLEQVQARLRDLAENGVIDLEFLDETDG